MTSRSIAGSLVAVVVGLGVLMYAGSRQKDWDTASKEQLAAAIATMPDYQGNDKWYYDLIEKYHPACYEECFAIEGGRRYSTKARFNGELYLDMMFSKIIDEARRIGNEKRMADLERLRPSVSIKF